MYISQWLQLERHPGIGLAHLIAPLLIDKLLNLGFHYFRVDSLCQLDVVEIAIPEPNTVQSFLVALGPCYPGGQNIIFEVGIVRYIGKYSCYFNRTLIVKHKRLPYHICLAKVLFGCTFRDGHIEGFVQGSGFVAMQHLCIKEV